MLHKPRPFEQLGTDELMENQMLREETGQTNKPFKSLKNHQFDKKVILFAAITVIILEILIPGSWIMTCLIFGLIIINDFLDAL